MINSIIQLLAKWLGWEQTNPEIPHPMPPEPTPSPVLTPASPTSAGKLYSVAKLCLGEHLTLNPSVPEEEGCAEAVSYLLRQAGYHVPTTGIQGVLALTNWMLANGFKETITPIPGCVITAHSVNQLNTTFAHAGVVLQHGVGSNTSSNGLFQENYTLASWHLYFGNGGSKTRYFSPA